MNTAIHPPPVPRRVSSLRILLLDRARVADPTGSREGIPVVYGTGEARGVPCNIGPCRPEAMYMSKISVRVRLELVRRVKAAVRAASHMAVHRPRFPAVHGCDFLVPVS